ncbi:MAG: hypothetical protein MAG453_01095 [Calditrichaeota bacterium]|nr:hypothetical protein [Calditrichota bacterium]
MVLPERFRPYLETANAILHAVSSVLYGVLYIVGLIAFLCGAAVPIAVFWFFLNLDIELEWWHVVLGVGGNIGIFVVSMTMLRDMYMQPLIEKIEESQNQEEAFETTPVSRTNN